MVNELMLEKDDYDTFITDVFHSAQFGTPSFHGRASTLRFNFLRNTGHLVDI
ncbi:MAG: hypothetical protein ACJAXH_001477 [Colwellia sp.]|jgi:hypothetical protein